MAEHSELEEEQAYLDHAYACLERARSEAERLRDVVESGRGGTHQARFERDVFEERVRQRLARLDLADDVALVFGRIDRETGEAFHIGRLAVADEDQEPVVVDWRAPVAEPFYRATGRDPMGLVRRRHFAVRGRKLLDLEDEMLGAGLAGLDDDGDDGRPRLRGQGALLATLEQSRTGRLGDVVATIQAEQDEVIRSDLAGVLVVQGGPGTGKTVVALHRAAYLLYTHRFPLEGQGVLVIGPNRLFLRYIERVLPSLGEAGVEQVVLEDLVPDVVVRAPERAPVARVKGDARMSAVVAKAVRDRERPLREDLVLGWGLQHLRLRAEESARIVSAARRRYRRHNPGRRYVEQAVFEALAASARAPAPSWQDVRDRLRSTDEVRAALDRMWPVLTPQQLLHDLYGSTALLRLAGAGRLQDDEWQRLRRDRAASAEAAPWTPADLALLDEARALLGPRAKGDDDDEARTYGHIVVDEAQDLSPMQLRMVARRSLGGSMTVVGDIAQATGALAPGSWEELLAHLPDRRPARRTELTVGYRIPAQAMAVAARVLKVIAPELTPPVSVRAGEEPRVVEAADRAALGAAVAAEVKAARATVGTGNLAVVAPPSLVDELSAALDAAGVAHGRAAARNTLDAQVNLVPVELVKGLELDAAVVVEPAAIVAEEAQGLRALYVALTRATKRLAIVHAAALPEALT